MMNLRAVVKKAPKEALLRYGKPRIFNSDQGSPFTAEAFTGKLVTAGVEISMDGRGRFMDNIFIERLRRSIKYEEVHLKAYADGREARAGIGSWMIFLQFSTPSPSDEQLDADGGVARPLHLDNANALPTYPQLRQKQQEAA